MDRVEITDDALLMALCTRFPHLERLDLRDSSALMDQGVLWLSRLKKMQHLSLRRCSSITSITDEGLRGLSGLVNLQHLDLTGCNKITDEGLRGLSGLVNLQHLNLSDCNKITDEGLRGLSGLVNLQHLSLQRCNKITDEGLRGLSGLVNLQHLSLQRCNKITDEGLRGLSGLVNLQHLDLEGISRVDWNTFNNGIDSRAWTTFMGGLLFNYNYCWRVDAIGACCIDGNSCIHDLRDFAPTSYKGSALEYLKQKLREKNEPFDAKLKNRSIENLTMLRRLKEDIHRQILCSLENGETNVDRFARYCSIDEMVLPKPYCLVWDRESCVIKKQ
jgi:hypothetical protein